MSYEVPNYLIRTVRNYYAWNRNKPSRGENWLRVLIAFGVESHPTLTAFTAAEAREEAKRWNGWNPILTSLEKIEASRIVPEPVVEEPDPEPVMEEEPPAKPKPVLNKKSNSKLAEEIVNRINKIRESGFHCVDHKNIPPEKHHLIPRQPPSEPLEIDRILTATAESTIDDMEAHPEHWLNADNLLDTTPGKLFLTGLNEEAHSSADGTTPGERLRRAEESLFASYPSNRWNGWGEINTIFAANEGNAAERAVQNWCDSFQHCMALTSGKHTYPYTHIGSAIREIRPGQWAACVWFGQINPYWEWYPNFFTW